MDRILTLLFGWVLDLIFGDPEKLPHPVVYMGKWIAFWEHRLNKENSRLVKGAVFAISSILGIFVMTKILLHIAYHLDPIICWTISTVFIFFCLAGHTLRKEVRMVFEAVDRSIDEGRAQVARIVGRDTNELSAQEVRTAALETLAENLSDGIIAPLFWYLLLGVPGMLTYKMINTMDSMIGYQNPRYKDFGCWAAKIDDIANYIPARLSALLIIISAAFIQGFSTFAERLKFTLFFGPKHASPNSGWPEAALASVLNCQFGGSHNYFGENFYKPHIGTNPRPLTTEDMKTSLSIMLIAEMIMVIFTTLSNSLGPYFCSLLLQQCDASECFHFLQGRLWFSIPS